MNHILEAFEGDDGLSRGAFSFIWILVEQISRDSSCLTCDRLDKAVDRISDRLVVCISLIIRNGIRKHGVPGIIDIRISIISCKNDIETAVIERDSLDRWRDIILHPEIIFGADDLEKLRGEQAKNRRIIGQILQGKMTLLEIVPAERALYRVYIISVKSHRNLSEQFSSYITPNPWLCKPDIYNDKQKIKFRKRKLRIIKQWLNRLKRYWHISLQGV